MTTLQPEKFIRKVRPVEGVKVTEDNLSAVAGWCGGLVVPANTIGDDPNTYIHVPVRNARKESDTRAYIGSWIVKEDFRNCRVVNNKQFRNSYDPIAKANKPAGPSPSTMPQKKVELKQVGAVEVVPGTPADEGSNLTTGTKERHVNRDASSGEFVTDEVAAANPATTVTETINKEEFNLNSNELSGAQSVESGDIVADQLQDAGDLAAVDEEIDEAVGVVPGDMIDHSQPEQDEDGTVQLGVPVEAGDPELCGQCGSQVIGGVCSNDIEHDVFGQAPTGELTSTTRIVPGD